MSKKEIYKIARKYFSKDQSKAFTVFILIRFPDCSESYLHTWIKRIINGTHNKHADGYTLEILKVTKLL